MKVFFRTIHLYLSLAAGIVIAIICLTGALLVFEKEMQQTIYPERYKVTPGAERVSLDKMVSEITQKVPAAKVSSIKIFADPTRTVEVSFSEEKKGGKNKTTTANSEPKSGKKGKDKGKKEGGKGNGSLAFINPYSGELISFYKQRNTFFFTVFSLHRWLLNEEIGKMITGISTFFFLFILLTGIILWWPKNKKILKQRLTLKWDGGWKRINHDLHIVLGFYTSIFLFAFAFTGLAWSFKWFNDGIYLATGTENKQPEPPLSVFQNGQQPVSIDAAYAVAKAEMPGAVFYNLNLPHEEEGAISVWVMPKNAPHEKATDQLFLDQYSGKVLKTVRYSDKNLGQRVRSTFYPVHVGSIGGLPGRIIAFISCLAGFTFPVSGIILWLNRLKKKKKKAAKKVLVTN